MDSLAGRRIPLIARMTTRVGAQTHFLPSFHTLRSDTPPRRQSDYTDCLLSLTEVHSGVDGTP